MPPRPPRTVLAQLMNERAWSVTRFCRRFDATAHAMNLDVATSERTVKHWRAGAVGRPHEAACRVLEHIFGIAVEQLLAPPAPPPARVSRVVSVPAVEIYSEVRGRESPTDRREFLGVAALSLAAAETLRQTQDGADALTIADLESDVDDVAASYDRTPPADTLPIVAAGWTRTRSLLGRERLTASDERRLTLLAGQFTYFLGRVMFAEGRYRESRRFAETSERYALKTEDPMLPGSLAALHSSIAFYTGRYMEAALYAGTARAAAPTYLAARLAAYEARAWSAARQSQPATDALAAMRTMLVVDSSPLPGSSPFTPASADMFTAVCTVRLRDGHSAQPYAQAAVERLSGSEGSYEERGHAFLALANSYILRDRPDPAAAVAAATAAVSLPTGHVTSSITTAAHRVWRRLETWHDDADVRHFGQLTASA
ncbi:MULTISPECIES: hypothetical protein, partial [unclassified Frankia]|uniref:hypothetical protein n=1 Tax=unclassified Frankia TaxID=2632575 RepID=UPI001931C6CF